MPTPVLWHFPISHYNEKVRWALDWKGLPHRRETLGASYLWRAWRATGTATLPVLHLDGKAIGDSTRIIAALERCIPDPPLYPADPDERARALALEDWFDEEVGSPVRTFLVGNLLRRDPRDAIAALATGMPEVARMANRIRPLFVRFYCWRHAIDDTSLAAAAGAIEAALARIERELGDREHLIGDRFSVADLTAAALLAPIVQPPEYAYPPAGMPPGPVADFAATHAGRAAWAWVLRTYARYRGTSSEVA